jgi:23S rRNA (uracil1939-C5)-methyltransferase
MDQLCEATLTASSLCRHFGTCGGCTYQDLADDAYRALKRASVVDALARHGLADVDVAEIIEVAPATRRRAAFKSAKRNGAVLLGFHAAPSHDIVDMRECLVLTPSLFALVPSLRAMMAELLDEGQKADLFVTETQNGADVAIRWSRRLDPTTVAALAHWATKMKLARITANGEPAAELAAPSVRFGTATVVLPAEAFLQPTSSGEAILQEMVAASLKGVKSVIELFAGCGTFALVLAEQSRVHAVEQDRLALEALAQASRATSGLKPVTTEKRDLYKRPVTPPELARFDAVLLDPPRAGASAQARELAQSKIRRIVYVSCNPESFARDARILAAANFRLGTVQPVDQFLWSSHIELVAAFRRD